MKYRVWSRKTTGCEHEGESLEFALSEGQRIAKETEKETYVEKELSETKHKRIAYFYGNNF